MADHEHDQKTEQPTEKRLREAAARGEFARTPELTVVLVLAAALGVIALSSQPIVGAKAQRWSPSMSVATPTDPSPLGEDTAELMCRSTGELMLRKAGAELNMFEFIPLGLPVKAAMLLYPWPMYT